MFTYFQCLLNPLLKSNLNAIKSKRHLPKFGSLICYVSLELEVSGIAYVGCLLCVIFRARGESFCLLL